MTIAPEVLDVLKRSTITATSVKLPPGQLERSLYEGVNKVLALAGGKWNRSAKAHLFTSDPRTKLGLALETGKAVNVKKELQAFDTPRDLCREIVRIAGIEPGHLVLEPSAGLGMLALEARDAGGKVDCVEIDDERAAALRRLKGLRYINQRDFLTHEPMPVYDRVVMNPPFTKGQDIKHVAHALRFLKPGGTLVAIMMPTTERPAFRKLLDGRAYTITPVDPGAFKESGTMIKTAMVSIR